MSAVPSRPHVRKAQYHSLLNAHHLALDFRLAIALGVDDIFHILPVTREGTRWSDSQSFAGQSLGCRALRRWGDGSGLGLASRVRREAIVCTKAQRSAANQYPRSDTRHISIAPNKIDIRSQEISRQPHLRLLAGLGELPHDFHKDDDLLHTRSHTRQRSAQTTPSHAGLQQCHRSDFDMRSRSCV